MKRSASVQPNRRRSAQVVLETLLVMPILIMILGAGFILGILLLAEQKVDEASGLGARVGSVGGTDADIRAAVRLALGDQWSQHATVCIGRETTPNGYETILVKVTMRGNAVLPSTQVIGLNPAAIVLVGQTVMRVE